MTRPDEVAVDKVERLHQIVALQILPDIRNVRQVVQANLVLTWGLVLLVGILICLDSLIIWKLLHD